MYKKDIFVKELKNIGFEAEEFGYTNLVLKLPLSTKIYVNINEDSFNLEPKFGLFKRRKAIYIDLVISFIILLITILNENFNSYFKGLIFAIFIGIILGEVYRWFLSQRAINKIYSIIR